MADLIAMLSAAAGAAAGGGEVDPNFNQTVLLLHGDGTDGAQNNTFLDSSTNNFTITRNGNTTQGTFSPFSLADGQWSNYFDGSGDYLSIAANSAFLYTGDFTVEMWVYPLVFSDFRFLFGTGGSGTQDQANIYANGTYVYFDGTNSVTSPTLNLNAWNHIAVTRSGTTIRAYANGVSGTSQTKSGNLGSSANAFRIGERSDGLYDNNCYMSNLRVVNGTAVYTGSTYTVPTTPLTAITNTSLLTCQSNRFVDNSTNAFAITVNGNTSVQPFSPFAPTAAYSASVNGGSGYFDGTGDYLTITSGVTDQFDPGSGFTLECWVYVVGTSTTQYAFEVRGTTGDWNASTGIVFQLIAWHTDGNCKWQFKNGSPTSISGTRPPNNAWAHLCVGYDGTTTRFWLNGVSVGTSAAAYSPPTYSNVAIGSNVSANVPLNGYVGGLRFVKGTDIYGVSNTTITVPTTPFTAVSGTSLLCNFTNAGIFDNTGKNNLETVGNAQIDTTVKKYGTGSMEFDGTGDYLKIPSSTELAFGTGDFTVEFWYYTSTTSGWRGLVTTQTTDGEANTFRMMLVTGNTGIRLKVASTDLDFTQTLVANAWNHVALVKSNGVYSLYYNGTKNATTHSNSTSLATKPMTIGANFVGGIEVFNGFIDDLRITKGVARYTTTFTPPTKAFPDL